MQFAAPFGASIPQSPSRQFVRWAAWSPIRWRRAALKWICCLLFAISAWLLAGLGVYGVVAYSVVQRRQEIGLRMALGDQREKIYAQVLREGLTPVLAGAVVGIAVAFASARLIGSLLFQVDAFNPWITRPRPPPFC